MIEKIYKNWLEILWNLIIRYFFMFIIGKYLTNFTDEKIIYIVNSVIWTEIILYEIWNSKKNNSILFIWFNFKLVIFNFLYKFFPIKFRKL